jgi:hypothetical protein
MQCVAEPIFLQRNPALTIHRNIKVLFHFRFIFCKAKFLSPMPGGIAHCIKAMHSDFLLTLVTLVHYSHSYLKASTGLTQAARKI